MTVAFRRTVWTKTADKNAGLKEDNDCALWMGSAASVGGFMLAVRFGAVPLGPVKLTPRAQVSTDGESWSNVTWTAESPEPFGVHGIQAACKRLGPYHISPDHGGTVMRLGLLVETPEPGPGGVALRMAEVFGTLTLLPPE